MAKNNKLPKDGRIRVTWLVGASSGDPGHTMIAYHDNQGWHGIDESGKVWSLFAEHLRNPDICKINVIDE